MQPAARGVPRPQRRNSRTVLSCFLASRSVSKIPLRFPSLIFIGAPCSTPLIHTSLFHASSIHTDLPFFCISLIFEHLDPLFILPPCTYIQTQASQPTSKLAPQVLQLGSNQVASITSLHLGSLGSLRSLFLQNNDITRIDGLLGLVNLQVRLLCTGPYQDICVSYALSHSSQGQLHRKWFQSIS